MRPHDLPSEPFRDLRDDGVTEPSKAVHPMGYPMSHSTQFGFKAPPTTVLSSQPPQLPPRVIREGFPLFLLSDRLGVGHKPDPISPVRGTKGTRRQTIPFRIVPALGQVSENTSHVRVSKQTWNVLHEDVSGSKCANGSDVFTPEP